jgi:beta-glucosidase
VAERFRHPEDAPAAAWVATTLEGLAVAEKVSLLCGAGPWDVRPPAATGLPALVMTDGPNGARGTSFNTSLSACFPCETSLAATWDPGLVTEVGAALGAEARRMGAGVLLAPTVNLHRNPLGGRNFECFSEDPELAGQLAAAFVTGVQSAGVACCVKHLVCNDQETHRHTASSEIDEAVLRELYLPPFEAAVRAGARAVMAAYNRLNGTWATEHEWLLTSVLREEWGFDGVTISDWHASQSAVSSLAAGLDVEMPGPSEMRGKTLAKAVADGELPEEVLDRSAGRVLRLLAWLGQADERSAPAPDVPVRALIRRAGARGMVLLRNDGLLPLRPGPGVVAVIGPGADHGQPQGGGSCQVNMAPAAGPVTALADRLGPAAAVRFARGCVHPEWPRPLPLRTLRTDGGEPGATVEYFLRSSPDGPPVAVERASTLALSWLTPIVDGYSNDELTIRVRATWHPEESGCHVLSLASIGRSRLLADGRVIAEQAGPGGRDVIFNLSGNTVRAEITAEAGRPVELTAEFQPPTDSRLLRLQVGLTAPAPEDLLDRAARLAAVADVAVVIAEHPPGVESEGHDRPRLGLPAAQEELIERVSAVNPRTVVVVNAGGAVAMPWADKVAAIVQAWYPGQELGDSLADVLTGAVNPSGKLPATFPAREHDAPSWAHYPGTREVVRYGEGLAMGYRGLAAAGAPAPLFPFGHGLSYSTFVLGEPELAVTGPPGGRAYTVTVPVTNTSDRAGREVVQLYVRLAPERPYYELKAFASVEVPPGACRAARLEIPAGKLRTWSAAGWVPARGPLEARIGTSSADLPLSVTLPAASPEGETP